MSKPVRHFLLAVTGLVVMVGVAALSLYHGMRQVPSFYRAALEQDEAIQTEASDQCLQQAAALVSNVQRTGRWQALFTAEQINGWLAVDLVKNYPDALPSEIDSPRVDIQSSLATLACGYRRGDSTTVVSISLDLYLSAPNVAALRVRSVRAGALPVPLSSVLEAISAAARNFDLELEWRQLHGDPVALVKLPALFDDNRDEIRLDAIELRDGAVFLAGQTGSATSPELARLERLEDSGQIADPPAEAAPAQSAPPESALDEQEPNDMQPSDMQSNDTLPNETESDDTAAPETAPPATTSPVDVADESPEEDAQMEVGSASSENVQR